MSDTRALALIASGALRIVEASEATRFLYAEAAEPGYDSLLIHYGYPTADRWHCECEAWKYEGHCVHVDACKLLFQPQAEPERPALRAVRADG